MRACIERVCIDEVPSPHIIRYTSGVGSSAPLHIGSAGKVLLAFMDETDRERSLRLLERLADGETPELSLRNTLRQAANDGYAISISERVVGALRNHRPRPIPLLLMSLSILGPTQRLPRKRLLELLPTAQHTANEIANHPRKHTRARLKVVDVFRFLGH